MEAGKPAPDSQGSAVVGRVVAIGAVAIASIVVAVVLLSGGGGRYEVDAVLENASQLVTGNLVKVGGHEVGKVAEIRLDDRNRAVLRLRISDDSLKPLHEGTRAVVRSTSLSGIANRYVALTPGPNNSPRIPDGGEISADDTQSEVDLDALIATLDAETRSALQDVTQRSAEQYAGVESQANRGLEALNPALSQTAATTRELLRDQSAFERFIVKSAAVVSAVGSRDTDLEQGIANAASATAAVASQRSALDESLRAAPPVLRRANTTLLNLRAALKDLRPALREGRPVAPRLSRLLSTLDPIARRAVPVVADLRELIPETSVALRGLPRVARIAVPAFRSATRALRDASPIVAGLRPYVPDVIAGLINGFGGSTGGYYDANGHYARISFQGGPFSLSNAGSLIPVPPAEGTLSGYRRGILARCPGAGTQPHPDRSNPFTPAEAPCKPEETPKP